MVFRNSKMKEKYFSQKYNTFIVIKFIKDCRSFEKNYTKILFLALSRNSLFGQYHPSRLSFIQKVMGKDTFCSKRQKFI